MKTGKGKAASVKRRDRARRRRPNLAHDLPSRLRPAGV